ncbi:hypothetical protein EDF59_110136 [Novosphingobium sp. ST904]|nr:hypothetical protein EDF59_110136 [Novosphingobium sp. ST904]
MADCRHNFDQRGKNRPCQSICAKPAKADNQKTA